MPPSAGSRLGPYLIEAAIGAGGMGQVYRARDTRLDRPVAIKILPDEFARDEDRLRRFEREARLIASLNHPNICAVHDVGRAAIGDSTVEYLVMEYLEGETLADRLQRGALPLDEAVRWGIDIATALDFAHRQRIIHRDLKPANVMLTRSGVKLLDFGLAKALEPDAPASAATVSLQATAMTKVGTVLGTVPYMAPEQLEGRPADSRSDIFALGAVIYEMVTGRRAFTGDSSPAVASAILTSDPAPLTASPSLDRLVRTCLAKQPDRRWQSAHDVALQLADVVDRDARAHQSMPRPARALLPWIIAAAAIVVAVAALAWNKRPSAPTAPAAADRVVLPIPPPDGTSFVFGAEINGVAISPDGSKVAFLATGPRQSGIWLRPLSSAEPVMIAGTEGATGMFWSPDSAALAFFAGGKLKRVDIAGGAPVTICAARETVGQFGTWAEDGTILFASVEGQAIMRVSKSGGTPEPLLLPDAAARQRRIVWPSFLPDGKRFLYLVGRTDNTDAIMLGSVDGTPSRELLQVKSNAQYSAGHIVYMQDGALLKHPFDMEAGRLTGEPTAVGDRVFHFMATGLAQFSVSSNGAVAYQSHIDESAIVTFDRTGKTVRTLLPSGGFQFLRLTPDGSRLIFDRLDPRTLTLDLAMLDLARGTETRLTTGRATEVGGTMAPDGSLIFSISHGGPPRLHRRAAGTTTDEPLQKIDLLMQIDPDVSRDGKWVVFSQRSPRGPFDIYAVSLEDRRVIPVRTSDADEYNVRFSPDGRFITYHSDESGQSEVYLAPFPGPGVTHVVSSGGGSIPRWSRDGREVFYLGADGTLTAVPVTLAPAVEIGAPAVLFPSPSRFRWTDFDVTADGRFVASVPTQLARDQPLTVILNALK